MTSSKLLNIINIHNIFIINVFTTVRSNTSSRFVHMIVSKTTNAVAAIVERNRDIMRSI